MKKRILKRALGLMLTGVLALGTAFSATSESVYAFEADYDGVGNVITEVEFDTKFAIAGEYLDSKGFIDYPWYSQLGEIEWYKDGVKVENPSQTKFEIGPSYSFKVRLQTDNKPEDRFADDVVAYVNGDEVEVRSYNKYDKNYVIELAYEDVYVMDTFKEVHIAGLDKPKAGCTPDMYVESLDPELYYIEEYNGYDVTWYNWGMEMSPFDVFEAGGNYEAVITLRSGEDYLFNCGTSWIPSRCVVPDVDAYIDGNAAEVHSAEFNPLDQIGVKYKFNLLDSEGIEYVNIYDLPYPIVGNNPEYKVGELGGCAYYIPNISENEYQKNGIVWMDVTDPNNEFYLTEEDEFLIGHQYKIIMDMVTEDGHVFVPDDEDWDETVYAIDITGYGIGEPVSLESFEGESDTHKKISFIYDCQPVTLDEIGLYDLDLPVAGEIPDYTLEVEEPELYELDKSFGINGVEWSNMDGTVMQEGDTFDEGEIYNVKVKVIPIRNKSWIYSDTKGFVNYGKGEFNLSFDGYDESGRSAYINRTFICVEGEEIKTGWIQIDDKWYYYDSKGVMAKGWKRINTRWYYFNTDGVMQASKWISGKYYVKSNGVMAVSEFVDGGKYYVDENGVWVNGTKWIKVNNNWYYLKSGIIQKSKWLKISEKYYYVDNTGIMQSSKWVGNYYVKANGEMAVSEIVDGGKYYVDENGKWVNETKWLRIDNNWYYLKSGIIQKSKWLKISGKYYYFDANGIMQTSKWIDGKYYVGEDGVWIQNP